jgi:outer membrane translocation and assembly module TamA
MSYKSENWKDKLAEVRAYGTFSERKEESIEQSADDILNNEIEEELKSFEEEVVVEEENIDEESMKDKIKKLFKITDKKATLGIAHLMSMTDPKVLLSMQKQNPKGFERMAKKLGELPEEVEVEETPVKESVEKSIEKLTEKNMLGRLAKQLKLNEQGKQQMFDYFEKGELKQ